MSHTTNHGTSQATSGRSKSQQDPETIDRISEFLAKHRTSGRIALNEYESKLIAQRFGLPIPAGRLVTLEEFETLNLQGIKPPFAVKFMSPDIQHKSDVGGVRLNISSSNVAKTCREMVAAPQLKAAVCDGFLVEEMATQSQELVLGGVNDPTFGPVVMVGIGGILTELLNDVAFRLCPVDQVDVREMLSELRGSKIIEGYRGAPPLDIDSIVDAVLALAGLDGLMLAMTDHISEVDVNPLIADENGVVAADVQIILTPEPESNGAKP